MSSLPEEMYHEIILRLPVQSLPVCKSVCKNWYAIISTSDFVKSHLNFTTQKNNPILMHHGYNTSLLYSIGYDSLASSVCDLKFDAIETDYPFKSCGYNVQLLSSCNGLVCLRLFNYPRNKEFLCLWNPATREYKELPRSPIEFREKNNMRRSPIAFNGFNVCIHACALGYDRKIHDYKLVTGLTAYGSKDSFQVQFYTLASNTWKAGQIVPFHFDGSYSGVLVNRDLHWLAKAQKNYSVLSLDISDESFKKLELPEELLDRGESARMNLGVLDGCLSVLASSYVNGVKIQVEVWEMLDYGVRDSWMRRYIITHDSILKDHGFTSLIWSSENGKILFIQTPSSVVLYDTERGSARKLSTHNNESVNYLESLVSLKSGTYVGREGQKKEIRGSKRLKKHM